MNDKWHLRIGLSCLTKIENCCCCPCSQVRQLFPSARNLDMTWHSIVKIGQSLYLEAPGMDPYRPDQATPVPNFFLAGSYTKQDYIDSMEGATLSGKCGLAKAICMSGGGM